MRASSARRSGTAEDAPRFPALGYPVVELHAGESEAIVGVDEGLPLVFKCAPRACGDDPGALKLREGINECSPRMRG